MRRVVFIFLLSSLGAGCTQFPELDGTISDETKDKPYVPFAQSGTLTAPAPMDIDSIDDLDARARALARRAESARRAPVIEPPIRDQLDDALNP